MLKPARFPSPRHGFSLVELSIVLVLIGLLIGGVMSGRNIIRGAELRSVIANAEGYVTAIGNFRGQYRYLPGDVPTANNYWGKDAVACNAQPGTAATPGTCNGNADGLITGDERFRFWQHLSLAGFLTKSVTGITGGGGANDFVLNASGSVLPNIPASRIDRAGFSAYYANLAATTSFYANNYGNILTFGGDRGTNAGEPINAVFAPDDAETIDTKADDGIPGTGNWIANLTGGGNFGTATSCSEDASGSVTGGLYRVANTAISCSFFIKTGF